MSGLLKANYEAIRADTLGTRDICLEVLQAHILAALCYQYTADERWKIKSDQIPKRRAQFDSYKKRAKELFDKLETRDSANAYDYERLKVKDEYPID